MTKHNIRIKDIEDKAGNTFYSYYLWAEQASAEKLSSYYEDSEGFITWPMDETQILIHGPMKARELGFLVEEFDGGFSAILPMRKCHQTICPGSCYVITVAKRNHEKFGTIIEFVSNEADDDYIERMLSEHGWTFNPGAESPVQSLYYDFNKPQHHPFL
jgi:hypothetical protein